MKKLSIILSVLGFLVSISMNAQTTKTKTKSHAEAQPDADPIAIGSTDAKATFVMNQDYLSKSSLHLPANYYGDSLKGFDEAAIKADLLSRHYHGTEFINVMNYKKREFINHKYKIGLQANPKPAAPAT